MSVFDFFKKEKSSTEIFVEQVESTFNRAVKTAIDQCGGNELIAGVLVHHAIASTYDSLRKNKDLLLLSGMSENEFQNFMERTCKKMLD